MTHTTFVTKNQGKYIDYDKAYGYQCVDLMRQYIKDVRGLLPYQCVQAGATAYKIWNNFVNNQFYHKVKNTPNGIPKRGDIVFFKPSSWFPFLYGFAGHVGIVDTASLMSMTAFEQNYPTGRPCLLSKKTYKDCLGWLTPVA